MAAGFLKNIKDFLLIPYKIFVLPDYNDAKVPRFGLRSNKEDRIDIALKYARGRLLDVGCGRDNSAIRKYNNGYGIDVYPWEGIDTLCDTTQMPFKKETFSSVSFIASFNHIPGNRVNSVLRQVHRVLKNDGLLLVTNTNPLVGYVNHEIFHKFNDIDRNCRGIGEGETLGYWHKELLRIMEGNFFKYSRRIPFLYHLSHLYIFTKHL